MKIYEALAEVKTLREKLVQLSSFRQSSVLYEADSEPDFSYDELSKEIDSTLKRITEFKLAIEAANLANTISVGNEDMSLAKAILELSSIRTQIKYISDMLGLEKRGGQLGRGYRSKEDVVQKWQKPPAELLLLQTEFKKRKNLLDSAIQEANHRVTITV